MWDGLERGEDNILPRIFRTAVKKTDGTINCFWTSWEKGKVIGALGLRRELQDR